MKFIYSDFASPDFAMICVLFLSLLTTAFSIPTISSEFSAWKQTHGKVYGVDEAARYAIFLDNLDYIQQYNNRVDTTMTLGLNEYSDMTHEEFMSMMMGTANQTAENFQDVVEEGSTYMPPDGYKAPTSIDWRTKGAVTPIKNQGACGSCYTFSAVGSLEGQWFRKTGSLPTLSEQQVLDCSRSYGNYGCSGGFMSKSFKYIKDAGGIDSVAAYPYEARVGYCRFRKSYVAARVTGFKEIPRGSESALQSAVASAGPVAVAIDASHRSFQMYRSGIYYEPACSTSHLSHAVLAIGYSTNGRNNYWIVKNSWGTSWGNRGYFYLLKDYYNHCGVTSMASYPLV